VKFTIIKFRQKIAFDGYIDTGELCSKITIVYTVNMCNEAFTVRPSLNNLYLLNPMRSFEPPGVVGKYIFSNFGVGMNLDPSFNTVDCCDTPDINQIQRLSG